MKVIYSPKISEVPVICQSYEREEAEYLLGLVVGGSRPDQKGIWDAVLVECNRQYIRAQVAVYYLK